MVAPAALVQNAPDRLLDGGDGDRPGAVLIHRGEVAGVIPNALLARSKQRQRVEPADRGGAVDGRPAD